MATLYAERRFIPPLETSSSKGFTLVEVLVASVILFFIIITLHAGFKQYAEYVRKQNDYERLYTTVLSIRDKLEDTDLGRIRETYGTLNGVSYEATVNEVSRKRNFVYGMGEASTGNLGIFQIVLYKVILKIKNREFEFYITQYMK